MSVNKVILIGNLGADPEVRYTPGGQPVANLRVATNEVWTDKDGTRQERTEWHAVSVWGKQAETCGRHLSRGRQVYVEGRLQSRTYEKNGQEHRAWDIVATSVQFLGGRDGGAPEAREAPGQQATQPRTAPASHGWGSGGGAPSRQGGGSGGGWGGGGKGGGGWGDAGGGKGGGGDDPIPF